jgi:hypothetical protein
MIKILITLIYIIYLSNLDIGMPVNEIGLKDIQSIFMGNNPSHDEIVLLISATLNKKESDLTFSP